jgi:putative mRNA 3-end processing factor
MSGNRQLNLFSCEPVHRCSDGILLTDAGLWLDASTPQCLSFVSHAHTDHISPHERALLTPPTRRFFDLRLGNHRTDLIELDYNAPYRLGNSTVTLFPAGHILGSAQLLIENNRRTVYTGDLKLRPSPACETAEVKRCDLLIMEATFGSPEYVFPCASETDRMLKQEIDNALNQGLKPVVRAYALGKAQEVVAILSRFGYTLAVDPSVKEYCAVYESFGVKLGKVASLAESDSAASAEVLIVGTGAAFRDLKTRFRRGELAHLRTIFVSGWGVDPNVRYRYGVDVVIPLSDHADYYDLIEYVRQAQPREVLVTHGVPGFAQHLNQLGFKARYLG